MIATSSTSSACCRSRTSPCGLSAPTRRSSAAAFGRGSRSSCSERARPLAQALGMARSSSSSRARTRSRRALLDLPLRLEKDGRLPRADHVRRVPGSRQGALRGRDLRSHIQHQGEVASYVFAGSEQGLMQELFGAKERPLYGQAVPMRLGRLADADIAAYIVDRFRRRTVPPAMRRAARRDGRGPSAARDALRVPLWDEIPEGGTGMLPDWDASLDKTLLELEPEFEGAVAAVLPGRAQEPARGCRGTRSAPADERARAARRGQDLREPRAPQAGEPGRGRRRRRRDRARRSSLLALDRPRRVRRFRGRTGVGRACAAAPGARAGGSFESR